MASPQKWTNQKSRKSAVGVATAWILLFLLQLIGASLILMLLLGGKRATRINPSEGRNACGWGAQTVKRSECTARRKQKPNQMFSFSVCSLLPECLCSEWRGTDWIPWAVTLDFATEGNIFYLACVTLEHRHFLAAPWRDMTACACVSGRAAMIWPEGKIAHPQPISNKDSNKKCNTLFFFVIDIAYFTINDVKPKTSVVQISISYFFTN